MNLRAYLICRILFTLIFVITSTTIWFQKDWSLYRYVNSNIVSNEIVFSNLKHEREQNDSYKLKIINEEDFIQNFKVMVVPTVLKNNVSNNYIKYQINDGIVRSLNMDGIIMVDTIDIHEEKELSLRLWISDTYFGDLNYDGRVVVS